jgi:5'-methylthioadenosine phosphorylase
VTDILALSAIGSLREEMAPGQIVAVDQFIDRTVSRERTFFSDGFVAHVNLADPVCSRLTGIAADAAEAAGAVVHRGGCYVAIEGPQFSTRAESRMFRSWGGDVIGMTAMPEARLAREAELPYALLGMVTDYDSWREGEEGVEVDAILAVMRANAAIARETVAKFIGLLPARRAASPIDRALDHAIVTPREHWHWAATARLDAVAGRLMQKDGEAPSKQK